MKTISRLTAVAAAGLALTASAVVPASAATCLGVPGFLAEVRGGECHLYVVPMFSTGQFVEKGAPLPTNAVPAEEWDLSRPIPPWWDRPVLDHPVVVGGTSIFVPIVSAGYRGPPDWEYAACPQQPAGYASQFVPGACAEFRIPLDYSLTWIESDYDAPGGAVPAERVEDSPDDGSWTPPDARTLQPITTPVLVPDDYDRGSFLVYTPTGWTPRPPIAIRPGAPEAPYAWSEAGAVTVDWNPPARDGHSVITGYEVAVRSGGEVLRTLEVDAGARSLVLDDLPLGALYAFTVTARNAVGTGPASAPSEAVTPVDVPAAPVVGEVTRANAAVTVRWTAPDAHGTPITGYTVEAWRGSSVVVGTQASATARSAVVRGLTNGTAYRFTVTATNAAGTGPASARSAAVTPATTPGVPTVRLVTSGYKGTATVSWSPPYSTGGAPVGSYAVRIYRGGSLVGKATASGTATRLVVRGLRSGVSHTFTVAAVNDVGSGAFSGRGASVRVR